MNILRTLHIILAHMQEQEYNILLLTGILLDINEHLHYAAELDSLATQEG